MPRRPYARTTSVLAILALTAGTACAQGPAAPSSWHISGGYTHYKVGGSNGWGDGGEAILYHAFGSRIGGQFRATIIASSDGFYTFTGAAVDLGPALPLYAGQTGSLILGLGASALLGGDSDGSVGFGIGGHGSLRATVWPAPRIGFYAEGAVRLFQHGETNPAFSGGITFGL
jgi:hypothetical protein